MDKKQLTETDIRTKFILPAIEKAGWDEPVRIKTHEIESIASGKIKRIKEFLRHPYSAHIKENYEKPIWSSHNRSYHRI